jgi:polysaccharide deacetylase family protein (PEP-CTERM system associated)
LITNALTFDVEDWYHATYLGVPEGDWSNCESRINIGVHCLLEVLAEANVKATFFILGCIAERNPGLIRSIAEEGHELASHSYRHTRVFNQSPREFEEDLIRSIEAIRRAAGEEIYGYRAPAFSIGKDEDWALDILVKNGIRYDSSMFPVRTPLYGIAGMPRFAHRICDGRLLEIPLTTINIGKIRLPLSGGTYTRLLPLWVTEWAIRNLNQVDRQPMVLYMHPWELDPHPPSLGKNIFTRWIHTINKGKMERRLRRLLSKFTFGPIREVFDLQSKSVVGTP